MPGPRRESHRSLALPLPPALPLPLILPLLPLLPMLPMLPLLPLLPMPLWLPLVARAAEGSGRVMPLARALG